jgi:hypothetical protein
LIKLVVCVEGGPSGSAKDLAQASNDFLDAIVILRVRSRGGCTYLPTWSTAEKALV